MGYRLGNATILLSCAEYDAAQDIGDDSVGGGDAFIKTRDFRRVWKKNQFMLYAIDERTVEDSFRDNPDGTMTVSNDDLIVFLNAIQTEPRRKYEIHFNGLSLWFWHDVTHAQTDVQGGAVYVDAAIENRALYNGAKLAREQGVKVGQIVRELVKAEAAYLSRFKTPTNALERFLADIDADILTNANN